jgi:hypothetical protein
MSPEFSQQSFRASAANAHCKPREGLSIVNPRSASVPRFACNKRSSSCHSRSFVVILTVVWPHSPSSRHLNGHSPVSPSIQRDRSNTGKYRMEFLVSPFSPTFCTLEVPRSLCPALELSLLNTNRFKYPIQNSIPHSWQSPLQVSRSILRIPR